MMWRNAGESCRGAGVQQSRAMLTPVPEQRDTAGVGRRLLPTCRCSASTLLPTSLMLSHPPFCPLRPAPRFSLPSHRCFPSLWMAPTQPHTFLVYIVPPPLVLSLSLLLPLSAFVSLSYNFLFNSSAGSILNPTALLLLYASAHFCSACEVK